jgi:signal transduction histidine kinase
VVPITSAGQARGFLVAGFSTRRILDADYQSFFDLVGGHISTAVGNARAYQEERKRAEALAELDRSKTAFFSNVSHEFRTPLTLILGPLEDELRAQTHANERLNIAHRNALRLLKLVNTLLDFSRIEAGRIEACYEPTDLGTLTTELASVFRSAIEKAGLSLSVDCPRLPEDVYVDRDMWEKIVLNLLSNAFKFTFEGGIGVTLCKREEHVELSVTDTGVGIAPSELPRIFERFHRVRGTRSRTYEGSGIGLALVQELVKQHRGNISVHSVEGRGSTFTVSIPLGMSHLPHERLGAGRTLASTASGARPFLEEALRWLPDFEVEAGTEVSHHDDRPHSLTPGVNGGEKRHRILLADDNADMRDYLRRLLGQYFDVTTAGDGEAAFAAACAHQPDLVLSDVMMPHLDGFGLVQRLRSHPQTSAIPIILLSARAGEEARVEGLQHGADDYVTKPFNARELLARIRTTLDLQRVRREASAAISRLNAELSSELAQKEALLKEVHHRVKNNLQVIISMLNLQANRIEDDRVLALFDQTRNRVYSIAAIHELLYRSASLAEIDLAEYARRLVPELARFYQLDGRIHVSIEGDSPTLEMQRAVPYGLLLNELVSNAFKHAFPGEGAGSLSISLEQRDRRIALTVADDGIGLPQGIDCEGGNTLGLQLARMLALQLGGSVRLSGGKGTVAVVEFPHKLPEEV